MMCLERKYAEPLRRSTGAEDTYRTWVGQRSLPEGGWAGEELSLISERPESLDPVKGTTKHHTIPDRASLGGLLLHLIHSSLRRPVRDQGLKRNWTLSGHVGGTSPRPVERDICFGCGNARFLGRWAGTDMVDLVQSGGGAPVGVLPDIFLARPVVAAWMNQHLTCLRWPLIHPRPKRSGTRSGSGCGPGPWAV